MSGQNVLVNFFNKVPIFKKKMSFLISLAINAYLSQGPGTNYVSINLLKSIEGALIELLRRTEQKMQSSISSTKFLFQKWNNLIILAVNRFMKRNGSQSTTPI